ncbi:glutamine synthetase nodule isozyme-like protein isoform X2 [Cinnamomum micranthum f. kanehirae]|uniref:Glutamine synthetase nodule isozyme-like protein isoform X2 n=1 Tax=Cinnamomum micranthum f. kanehirae TaxID=337451 RepID=A0A443PI89_9MAGN|nr:glutamine synthetase nodule isozyme-like protein isoform X2 [Cinnamomum micranthum f. kanehirae]
MWEKSPHEWKRKPAQAGKCDVSRVQILDNQVRTITIRTTRVRRLYRIGGFGMDIRSKAGTLSKAESNPQKLPKWNYDGSSTDQAPRDDSKVILYPQAVFRDPFRRGNNILVMCECDACTPRGDI